MYLICVFKFGHKGIAAVGRQPYLVMKLVISGATITSNWAIFVYRSEAS
jgi:EamA domain-containing membrane protein RarD